MTACKVWPGACQSNGYGVRRLGGRKGKTVLVHRLAWEETHGPIPDGKHVLHTCDNPPCYEISHLFVGDPKANAEDREAKGRSHWNGRATRWNKLPAETVAALRLRRAQGETMTGLAREVGVHRNSLHDAFKRYEQA